MFALQTSFCRQKRFPSASSMKSFSASIRLFSAIKQKPQVFPPAVIRILSRLKLFQCYFSANFFQFSFDCFSVFFGSLFFQYFGSAVYSFFSFFQAQTCYFTNNFDYFDFFGTNFCQFNVEFCFIFGVILIFANANGSLCCEIQYVSFSSNRVVSFLVTTS